MKSPLQQTEYIGVELAGLLVEQDNHGQRQGGLGSSYRHNAEASNQGHSNHQQP